jgi:branched-chain amino acid transport system substrate-binding protein
MSKFRGAIIATLVTAGMVLLAGCGSSNSSSSGSSASSSGSSASTSGTKSNSPFIELASVDLTGPTSVYGKPELAALEAAANLVNQRDGGILGHKIVVRVLNDNGDPQTGASTLISYLSSHPKPNNFFTGAESTLDGATIPIGNREGLLMVTKGDGNNLFATGSAQKYPLGFQIQGSVPPLVGADALFFHNRGIKKVGILLGEYAYAEGELPLMKAALAKYGIQASVVDASLTATSLTPQLSQLKSDGAQAIWAALVGASSTYTFAARAQLGWNVPIVGEGSFSGTDLTKTVPAAQRKDAYITLYPDTPTNTDVPGVAVMKQVMGAAALEKYGVPIDVEGDGWDTIIVLKDGAEHAHSIDPQKIAQALETMGPFTDPLFTEYKTVQYSATDHQNFAPTPSDFAVVPIGPIVSAQVPVAK